METFSALLAICAGNSPVPGEFPTQRPVAQSFDVFFDLRLNKRLSKQWRGWWFETQSCPLWRHRNADRDKLYRQYVHSSHGWCSSLAVREITKSSNTFSATNIGSNMIWFFQLHDTIKMTSNDAGINYNHSNIAIRSHIMIYKSV